MSKALRKFIKHKKRQNKPTPKPVSKEEMRAFQTLRKEARAAKAKLANGGKGGLSSSLVLTVFRRDEYTCKVHGDHGEGEYGGLTLHHKGGIVESKWLHKKGHKNEPNNLVTLCTKAHNDLHNKAREGGVDSTQVQPEGDKNRGH